MDPEFALLKLELELLSEAKCNLSDLSQFGEAVTTAATTPDGYSGLAWKGGAKLLGVAQRLGQDPDRFFDTFGWRALANGIQTALRDKRLLSALSYASVPFLPPTESMHIFDHPQIVEAIRAGLATTPPPFIKPSDLGTADAAVQTQFGELLRRLPNFPVDNELTLQWSASALRILPSQSSHHQVAAINLLQALCSEGRFAAAYYAFRALAEQHEDLWRHPIALTVLQTFVSGLWQDEEMGSAVLAQLCVDDDMLRRCDDQFDILVLIGALAINLTRHYGGEPTEATAWHLVNEMLGRSALVAYALQNYLMDGSLPSLPISMADRLEDLKQEFNQAVALVEKELRPRRYALLSLAGKIYQANIQEVFTPLLDEIRSEHCSPKLVERIQEIDPVELITGSEWQKSSRYPIDGRMLRKMVGDNSRILQALKSAARKRIELDDARAEWAAQPDDQFGLFQDFGLLLEDLSSTATWALKSLLSDLWTRLQEGISIAAREQEARRHGTRWC